MLINLRNALMAGTRLPYDSEVEYLEGTGTQWIDAGVYGNENTVVRLGVQIGGYTSNVLFGCYYANGLLYNFFVRASNWAYFQLKSSALNTNTWGGSTSTRLDVELGNNYCKDLTTGTIVMQGDVQSSFTTDKTLKWFYYDRTASVTGRGKIFFTQIYQNNLLVRDLIPVRKGTVGYLYDRVSGKLFGNAGTGDFVLGPDVVPVEYIESYGAEYIDTGVDPAQDLPFECTFSGQLESSGYGNVFGSRYSSRTREYQLTCYNGGSVAIGSRTEYLGFDGGEKNTVSYNGINSVNINGTTSTIQTSTCSPTTGSIVLFGVRQNGTVIQLGQGRIYGVSFGTAANFLPVRVGTAATSWEGAMMDTLTRRIYRNAGTGAFSYGNDVPYPIPA